VASTILQRLRQLLGSSTAAPAAAIPAGERVYAVGDIHGRADLLAALIEGVDADDAARGTARTTVILLGDLIDRGPDSAGVIRLAREWQGRRTVRILAGNHEEMFLQALEDERAMRQFLRFGGREMLLSYPLDRRDYDRAELAEMADLVRGVVPPEDIAFMRSFEDQIRIGDYLFVHAGLRPGVELSAQQTGDLRWIREDFLKHEESFGPLVVHGHTISEAPEFRHNRIGIDTGAYRSGRLTALGLEAPHRWVLNAVGEGGAASAARAA
jgi:serine/threonine protein phosphatase 1